MPFEGPGELPPHEKRVPIPDDFGDYIAAVKAWLERHWHEGCPNCEGQVWRIQEAIVLLTAQGPWPVPRGEGNAYAAIPVTCTTCGKMELVNAFYIFRVPPP